MKKSTLYFFIALLGIFFQQYAHAQVFDHQYRALTGSKLPAGNLTTTTSTNKASFEGDLWTYMDPSPLNALSQVGHIKVKTLTAYVKLAIDHQNTDIWLPYTYRVLVEVKGFTVPGDLNTSTTFTDTFTISYDPDTIKAYQDVNMHTYNGYYRIEATVLSVYDWTNFGQPGFNPATAPDFLNVSSSTFADMAKNWEVEVNIFEQKYDKELKDASWEDAMAGATLDIACTPPQSGDNHLLVSWEIVPSDNPNPALYELEWTYVDNYDVTFSNPTGKENKPTVAPITNPANLKYNFIDNSTRIITDKNEYSIPLVYKDGYLVFRVRLIRPDETQFRYNLYNDWKIADNGVISSLTEDIDYYEIGTGNAHLGDDRNWNYQATYAEEGKTKSVVTYYDNLLKQRQTITKLNTMPDQQVVSQTYYNHEGKPALQTLPVPVPQQALTFVEDFAFPSGSTDHTYKPSDIDNISPTPLLALGSTSAAYNYYSNSNQFLNSSAGILKAIPDAEGFPLIHTRFAPEDGRVIAQGGAGKELQLGEGHETKNYYLPATQFELDKYFGFDIGKSPFYEKTITSDPNKQLSFSVANNKGQTVMSGLMGYPVSSASPLLMPDGINLPSNTESDFPSIDILYGHDYTWSGSVRKYSIPHFMEKAGSVLFNHAFKLDNYYACSTYYLNVPLKYSIKLLDEYGEATVLKSETIGGDLYGKPEVIGTNNPITASSSSLTATGVSIGKNIIDYEISYNPDDVNKVVDMLFVPATNGEYPCVGKTKQQLVNENIAELNFDCMEGKDEFVYECEQLKEMMKDELHPNGKYGKYSVNSNGEIEGTAGLFAPATNSTYPQVKYRYQNFLLAKSNAAMNGTDVYPSEILNRTVEEFIKRFDERNYGEALLDFHPEYCLYQKISIDCGDKADGVRPIEEVLRNIESFTVADVLGLYSSSSTTPLSDLADSYDPLRYYHSTNITTDKLIKMSVYYPPNPNGSTNWAEERIDHLAYVKTFCSGGADCRNYAMQLTEEQIYDNVYAASVDKKDEFIQELFSLYIANRKERIERLKYTLSTGSSSCSTATAALADPADIIGERVIKLMYSSTTAGTLPGHVSGSNVDQTYFATSTIFSGTAAARQDEVKNKLFANTANDVNGFNEYADQIVSRLRNCRKSSSGYDETALKTALLSQMTNAGVTYGTVWKGGITPEKLKDILVGEGYILDDLCNPYLVDYLHSPSDIVQEFDCKDEDFYEDLADFLYAHNADIQAKVAYSGNNSGAISTAVSITNFASSGNQFEELLLATISGGSQSSIYMRALNGYPNSNSFTLFFYQGSTFNMAKAVAITFDLGDVSAWNTMASSLEFDNFQFCPWGPNAYPPPSSFCDLLRFYSSSELSNRVTCIGPSDRDDLLRIKGYIMVDPSSSGHLMTGYIKGLKAYPLANQDQNKCITCVEMKDAFDKQSSSLASFKEDVMDEYSINGVGHPFFETVLASYLNFHFVKAHSADEYLAFMTGCDLAGEYKIPQLYSYMHASSTDLSKLDDIYDAVLAFGSGKYKDFSHFYYYKTTGSTVTEGNLYMDFKDFEKSDLRAIKAAINAAAGTATVNYGALEKDTRSEALTFTDLFVPYTAGASNGPDQCIGGPANENQNWIPKYGAFINCSTTATNPIDFTYEDVTVKHGDMLTPYRHFHMEFKNTPTADEVSEYTYIYNKDVLPDDSRSFHSWQQYMSTGSEENLNDEAKIDYLKYTYTKTCPSNYNEKMQLIAELQPDELKLNINGNSPYTADFNGYSTVRYFDKFKTISSGDLFVRKVSTGVTDAITFIKNRIVDIETAITANSTEYFKDGVSYNNTTDNVKTTLKFLPNNVLWYNIKDLSTSNTLPDKNMWLKFPDYLPFAGFDITSLQVVTILDSFKMLSSTTHSGYFSCDVYKASGVNTPSAAFPEIELTGYADFSLPGDNVYRNVMLCSDIAAENNDDFFLCYEEKLREAEQFAEIEYTAMVESAKTKARNGLVHHIQNNIKEEYLTMRTPQSSYMITLYGYDRAGNLAYTVPPKGVKQIWGNDPNLSNGTATYIDARLSTLKQYRSSKPTEGPTSVTGSSLASIVPLHEKITRYAYDANNRLVTQSTPDGGETRFYYDKAGKLICSQNAKQESEHRCAYTLYDDQGRITETGLTATNGVHAPVYTMLTTGDYANQSQLTTAINKVPRWEVIHTFYDAPVIKLESRKGMSAQEFLRNRPATIARYPSLGWFAPDSNFALAIHYSYDVSGNVKTLTYDMPVLDDVKQRYKRIDYSYDLYSGKVTLVSYNRSFADQFYQQYTYDPDNRIIKTETSVDGLLWDKDASYTYYPHGPLASVGLGSLDVQKLDFVYTLQGWLKAINGDAPNPDKDAGGDESTLVSSIASNYQEDLLRSKLYYFKDDYKAIDPTDFTNTSGTTMATIADLDQGTAMQSLYNGNIAAAVAIPGYFPSLYTNYTYDQLNRIKKAEYLLPDYTETDPADVLKPFSSAPWGGVLMTGQSGFSADNIYKSEYSYDLDGNLMTLKRYGMYVTPVTPPTPSGKYDYTLGNTTYLLDNLTYDYKAATTYDINQLENYTEGANHGVTALNDIPWVNTTPPGLSYDAIGNLTADGNTGLSDIKWDMYGKVTKVTKADGTYTEFEYDPLNNRFSKSLVSDNGKEKLNEYYIRDAAGNLLSVYRQKKKYKLVRQSGEILKGYTSVGSATLAGDIGVTMGSNGAFATGLMKVLVDTEPSTAADMVADKDVSFFIGESEPLKQAMIDNTDDIVDDLLANNASVIKNVLYSAYDEQFFTPLFADTTDSTRHIIMGMLVDSTDTTTITNIVDSLYPNANLPHANGGDFVDVLDFARGDLEHSHIHGVLAYFITGTKLEDAVDRLMANTHFMESGFDMGQYNYTKEYLHDVVRDRGSLTALQTYYDARTDGADILDGVATLTDKLLLVYEDNRQDFLETVLDIPDVGREIVGDALDAMTDMTPERLVNILIDGSAVNSSTGGATYAATDWSLITDYNKTWLAEHIMYGSSRLGIKSYWPTQYRFEWDGTKTQAQNQTLLEASPFYYRRAWYFKELNSLVKANETEPWGNPNIDNLSVNRVLGLKRYELSNHLGNVMAVVSDKITEVKANTSVTTYPTPALKRAGLSAAYDYYPFGMLMPERFVEDALQQCTPVTRSMMTKTYIPIWELPMSSTGAELFTGGTGVTMSYDGGAGEILMDADASNTPYGELALPDGDPAVGKRLAVEAMLGVSGSGAPAILKVMQNDGTNDIELGQTTVTLSESVTLDVTSVSNNDPYVIVMQGDVGAEVRIPLLGYKEIDDVQHDVVMIECNNDEFGTDYRFGFNGMTKDNNLKGIGNSLDFEARLYDSRLGRMPTLDPKFQSYASQSPYSAFNGNPIFYIDPTGKDGIAFWETSGKTKTLVIKADYHFIKGEFNENVLQAVKEEYGSYKKINYNGENVNVRFEIGFQPHDPGSDLSQFDGSAGQNTLNNKNISIPNTPELSDYSKVDVDVNDINNYSRPSLDGKGTVTLNAKDKDRMQVSTISHGIGHNIGLIHDDEGIMLHQNTSMHQEQSLMDPGKQVYRLEFNPNNVTKPNVQKLTDRIDDMNKQGRNFWNGKKDRDGGKLDNTGIIKMK